MTEKPINPLIQEDHWDTLGFAASNIRMVKDAILDPPEPIEQDACQMGLQAAIDAISLDTIEITAIEHIHGLYVPIIARDEFQRNNCWSRALPDVRPHLHAPVVSIPHENGEIGEGEDASLWNGGAEIRIHEIVPVHVHVNPVILDIIQAPGGRTELEPCKVHVLPTREGIEGEESHPLRSTGLPYRTTGPLLDAHRPVADRLGDEDTNGAATVII